MAAPKFAPAPVIGEVRSYRSPAYVPDRWEARRPGDLEGRQPVGAGLGYQGPDQGYALRLAAGFRPQLVLSDAERVDDAVAGCTAIAMRRAALYGRAPVIHDLRIAFMIWGFLDPAPDAELVGVRVAGLRGCRRPAPLRGAARPRRLGARGDAADDTRVVAETYAVSWRALLGA